MLHPHRGSIQQYMEQVEDPDRGRPSSCPQCRSKERLKAHGFYSRTIVDEAFDGLIRIRRYLCQACLRTVSLLPEWALPFMRFSIPVIARTVKARLVENRAWRAAAPTAPYQRGQHWVRRFAKQGAVVGGAVGIDGSEPSAEFYIQSAGYAGEDRLDGGASVSVFRPADASAGMGTFSGSAWAVHHDQRGVLDSRDVPTDHLHRLGKPIGLGFDSRRY